MINYFSILVIILGFSFSAFENLETGWSFDQSTSQAFYMFETIEICEDINDNGVDEEGECSIGVGDGCAAQECSECYCCQDENFNSCDVIGAFFDHDGNSSTEDVCVGWVYLDSAGWTTVPINGNDGGTYSENYPSPGDQVRFVIYDASQDKEIDLEASCNPDLNSPSVPGDCSFSNFGMFLYGESDYSLDNDIEIVCQVLDIKVHCCRSLDDNRHRVVANMCFNLGQPRFSGFKKFIHAMQVSDWERAAEEMMDSKWATQVGDRAKRLRNRVLQG